MVEFLVFNSIYLIKRGAAYVINRVMSYIYLLKAELDNKTSTNQALYYCFVKFLVLISIHQLISDPSDGVKREGHGDPDHAAVLHLGWGEKGRISTRFFYQM